MAIVFDDDQPKKIVFDDEQNQGSSIPSLVGQAMSSSPLGMVAQGAKAFSDIPGAILNKTAIIPVPEPIQKGSQALFRGSRALGVGTAEQLTGQPPMQSTMKTMEAFSPTYQPKGIIENVGAAVGETAPVAAASILSPTVGGPLAIMAQQAQTGKVSPLPALIPMARGASSILRETVGPNVLPPLLKATKGIPTNVTRMTLENPEILERPGTSESIQGKSQDIINAIKEANQKVGRQYGSAYEEAGMKSPVERIMQTGEPPKIPFNKLHQDYQSAMKGDLLQGMTDQQKLAALTDLKRNLQDQAVYPAPGQQLAPSQGSLNQAIKNMASDIDELRGKVPGGDKLALADDAYGEMKGLKARLMNVFRDPYTGQDYLNRLIKGNTDWLTSGRNAGKVGAIERIEQITGKQVLKPALQEMAASYLKNPDVMSLPSFGLKSIISALVPTKMLFGKSSATPTGMLGAIENTSSEKSTKEPMPSPPSEPQGQIIEFPVPKEKQKALARQFLERTGWDKEKAMQLAEDELRREQERPYDRSSGF